MFRTVKLTVLFLFLASTLIYAQAEKPKTTGGQERNAEFLKSREPVVEVTPEKQYDKALKQYNQALRVNYSKYNQLAIRSFEDYLNHYPQGKNKNDALFYLEKLYLRELDYKNHEKYLTQFRQEVPTSNPLYKLSDIDQAALYIRQNRTADAQQMLENLLSDKDNEPLKREIYHLQLSIYKPNKDHKKVIAIYEYLINDPNNQEFKDNKNSYYYYLFNLGELYYEDSNYQKSKYYFEKVANAKDFETTYMKEIAQKYLNKLKAIKPVK